LYHATITLKNKQMNLLAQSPSRPCNDGRTVRAIAPNRGPIAANQSKI
jgi:hypothetical protein